MRAPMVDEVKHPGADLRDWEVGASKPGSDADLDDSVLFEMARSATARDFSQFARDAVWTYVASREEILLRALQESRLP